MRYSRSNPSFKCHYLVLVFCFALQLNAQKKELNYYLPNIDYDESIPTPEEYLGYQIGEWHISHDQLVAYCRTLAEKSDRILYKEYARSHENRPLLNLIFTTPENHKNLEGLRQRHLKASEGIKDKKAPLVLYQGYSIHGNEASGSNAAMLVAYYLAAGKSKQVQKLLKDNIIIIDPSYNPDGLQRFSTWVNMHRSKNLNPDENDREYSEEWPGGRTNHYWFDLNRDWLLLVHPESQGRIKNYHYWKPNVLTDHHEMGKNSTFFFQPGVPSRTNPNTPQLNQDLTEEIAQYHMKALDKIGSKYFMKERFDDYYYGKGSTYPDANGAIGILFEQASARGHIQETSNGILSFPFAIRNQVTTSLSTQAAVLGMRKKLIDYQRNYYQDLKEKAANNPVKAYVYHDQDLNKQAKFEEKLKAHQINYKRLPSNFEKNGIVYPSGQAGVVSLDQKEYTLAKTIFEKVEAFGDSIFYDVSAWTMPLAFGIEYSPLNQKELMSMRLSPNAKGRTSPKVSTLTEGKLSYSERYVAMKDTTHKDHKMLPRIAMIVGDGVSSYYAGEIWHTLDQRYQIPITKIDIHQYKNSKRLQKYNTLIMTNGRYGELDSVNVAELKEWINEGGKLICIGTSLRWAATNGIVDLEFKKRKTKDPKTGEVKMVSTGSSRNANVIGGAIFETIMDLNHPLAEGYHREKYYSFKKGTHFLEEPKGANSKVVLRYTDNAKVSGYASKSNVEMINGSPALVVESIGKGKVVAFIDDPVFRGYWHGGFKLFMNAIFE